jgi:hypothetical protein
MRVKSFLFKPQEKEPVPTSFMDRAFDGGYPGAIDPSPWDKGQVIGECLRLRVVEFIEKTPLLNINGDFNKDWYHELAIGFPTFSPRDIQVIMDTLRDEQERWVEVLTQAPTAMIGDPAYRGFMAEPTLADTLAVKVCPKVAYDKESDQISIMIHGNWLLYVPGLASRT